MQKLLERHGVDTVQEALRFLSIRLRSRPETADLAQSIEQVRTNLRDQAETHAEAREARVAASAEIVYRDSELDAAVANLVREVMVHTKGRRDHQMYIKLFAQSPSMLTMGVADAKQAVFVKTLLDILRSDAQFANFTAQTELLEQRNTALQQAIGQRDELYVPESHASANLRVAMDQAKRIYNLAYPRLQLLFPNKRSLVESFFASLRSKRASGDAAELLDIPQALDLAGPDMAGSDGNVGSDDNPMP